MFLQRRRIAWIIEHDSATAAVTRFGKAAVGPLLVHHVLTNDWYGHDLAALESIPGWRQLDQAKKVSPRCQKVIRRFLRRVRAGESLPAELAGDEMGRALNVLAMLRDRRAVPILLEVLATGRYNQLAIWALGEIGDVRAVPQLKELFEKADNEYVRATCAEAMMKFDRSILERAGVDIRAIAAIACPAIIKSLWDRANHIGETMRQLECEPGGDPWALIPEMEAVLQECLRLDESEGRKLIIAAKEGGSVMLELHELCHRLLKQTK